MFKHRKGDLAERPNNPESLLRGFHGRPLKSRKRFMLPDLDLRSAKCVGRSETIFYLSDKRDPNDPDGEGRQGFDKRFYHEQKPASYFYAIPPIEDPVIEKLIAQCKRSGMARKAKEQGLFPRGELPSTIVELANFEHVDLLCGKEQIELYFPDHLLYVWDDMRTLMAWNPRDPQDSIYLWSSHHTHVNWRGIID